MKSDPKEAAGYYRAALALRPDTPVVLYSLGNALRAQGRPEEAKAEHEKAIALDPQLAESNGNLEQVLQTEGRLDVRVEYRLAVELGLGTASQKRKTDIPDCV